MKAITIENELREVVSKIITQVELSTKQSRFDINLVLEDAFIPILRAVFNLSNLMNLNRKHKNFPGIDLGDEFDRVAFQITSTNTLDKVKKTLNQFIDKKFHNAFDELYILMLTKKQNSYSQNGIDQIINDHFNFNTNEHIIDLGDLLEKITGLRLPAQERILNEFKLILGEIDSQLQFNTEEEQEVQHLFTNLIEVQTPSKVYVAEVIVDTKSTVEAARTHLNFKKYQHSKKTVVRLALLLTGKTTEAWVYHENKLFTFINLNNDLEIFKNIIDYDTVEELEARDFYIDGNEDNIHVFRQLLLATSREMMKRREVHWSNESRDFYFYSSDGNRSEDWVGKRKATRKVHEVVMSKKDPEKIAHHKHLSFTLYFINIGVQWYCNVIPSWLYTYNGYRKTRFHEDLLSKQKRLEFNNAVRNLTRFIAYFLGHSSQENTPDIHFKNLVEITNEHEAVSTKTLEPDELDFIEEELI